MKIEEQRFDILTEISPNAEKELRLIEQAGRTCYKSESGDFEKCKTFIKGIILRGHESVLEHSILTVKFTTSRTVSHQLVRHRLCAFSQESQRYCNYSQGRFEDGVIFIRPVDILNEADYIEWVSYCILAEREYMSAINRGLKPETARATLPNCTKTELVMSANYREWRHIFKERTSVRADPNTKQIMTALLSDLYFRIPVIFEDIKEIG